MTHRPTCHFSGDLQGDGGRRSSARRHPSGDGWHFPLRVRIPLLWLPVLLALSGGCATVEPWEREALSDPMMIFDENPIDAGVQEHHLDYREGSVGATGARGGGCGCG